MKVGVLTFHYTDNVGSVLQAYALKRAIEKLSADCEIINYQKDGWKRKTYGVSDKEQLKTKYGLLWPLANAYMLVRSIYRRRFLKKFKAFQLEHLECSGAVVKKESLNGLAEKFDKIVVGSDQVWNFTNVKVDDTYLLDFVEEDRKKIAYAASFGRGEVENNDAVRFAQYLPRFSRISVRESDGVALANTLSGGNAKHVLDPSFLLTAAEWKQLFKEKERENYVLIYLRQAASEALFSFAEQLANREDCQIVMVTEGQHVPNGYKAEVHPDPLEWMALLYGAKYVVTNSFHGVAFSINFNKQFFYEELAVTKWDTNSRINSIISLVGLNDRDIRKCSYNAMEDIDYVTVNTTINEQRKASLEYLKTALYEV